MLNTATATMEDIKNAETSELLETYNAIYKDTPIKKFSDRATAERRTWKAIQQLAPNEDISKPNGKVVKTKTKKAQKRESYDNRIIHVLVKENPKRKTSRAHKKFDILMRHQGKTLAEYKQQEGKFPTLDMEKGWPATEVRWAINLNLIKLLPVSNNA